MIILISPAKRLNLKDTVQSTIQTKPIFISDAERLVEQLRTKTTKQIGQLMGISDNLAKLNAQRFAEWSKNKTNSRQAIFTFDGDVYSGLDAYTLNKTELRTAQRYLRILSGLYGVLRPFDHLQPYRLEMGTKLKIEKHENLYSFWSNDVTGQINKEIADTNSQSIVNLASNEYSKVINRETISKKIIDVSFKDKKNGKYKVISFNAKKARGMMARFIIKNQIKNAAGIKKFNDSGYFFSAADSSPNELIFLKD